ncbi:hypothetical protein HaLaN_25246 [Haematococcus lacustris]|uniref:Uncharacterized protein n=1 Tax=Haematococcus lacustris TaxID=44745 RepID=A0A6A0A4A5_HAELA|nr:hypothetical protein HaLaN_25246 [Haematococcus lacustris]
MDQPHALRPAAFGNGALWLSWAPGLCVAGGGGAGIATLVKAGIEVGLWAVADRGHSLLTWVAQPWPDGCNADMPQTSHVPRIGAPQVVCMDGAELQEAQDLNPEFMQRMREAAAMGGLGGAAAR